MTAVSAFGDPCELLTPSNCLGRKRIQENAPQGAAMDLRPSACTVVGLVDQDVAVAVEYAQSLAALVDQIQKHVEQARCLEGELAAVGMDVQHSALRSRHRRGFSLKDSHGNSREVEDAGEGEAAKACTDNRDR